MKEYTKLDKAQSYDPAAAEELAEAMNEAVALAARADYLKELFEENADLQPFIWRTAENKAIALHKLEDSHLANIMTHLLESGRKISKPIKAEARKRKLEIPVDYYQRRVLELQEGDIFNLGDDGLDD